MRVLYVITSLKMGGAEKLVTDLIPRLISSGCRVDLLLFDGTETPYKRYLIDKHIIIFSLSSSSHVYNPLFIFKLIPYLKNYDIIHTHNCACQYFTAFAKILSFSKIALVTTEHSTDNRRRYRPFFKLIERIVYSQYKTVIGISDQVSKNLKVYLGNKIIVKTIANGIDIETYKNVLPCQCKNNKCVLVMVASFRPAKDQDTVIRALKLLPNNMFELWLVGDGPRNNILQDLTESLMLTGNVKFFGNRSNVPNILKAADIVIQSSHWEGFGLSAVEGMAAGKPVIASDVPGLSQVVEGYGILFEQGNERKLAEEIMHLSNDKSFYDSIALRSSKRADDFDIHNTVLKYLKIYNSLMIR